MKPNRWIYLLSISTAILSAIVCAVSWNQPVVASQDDASPALTRIVTKTADTNDGVCNADCSLREAVATAGEGDSIAFNSLFSSQQTITLGSQLLISRSVSISGPGARNLTITANTGHHIFRLTSANSTVINVEIRGMTLANVNVQSQTDEGGAVQVLPFTSATFREVNFRNNIGWGGAAIYSTGDLTLIDCSVVNNAPIDHGAIWITGGTANIANTTIGGNTAVSAYGGMVVDVGTVTMNNVTIAHNQGSTRGGVFVAAAARVRLRNTIIANNRNPAGVPSDVSGVFSSYSYNLIGVNQFSNFQPGLPNDNEDYVGSTAALLNPQLGPLANNGGPTDTYALLSASPAINRGYGCVTNVSCFTANPPVALAADQRRDPFPRSVQSSTDIGAFEYGTMAVTNTDDAGSGSLRNAIAIAPVGGAIGFAIPPAVCSSFCTINLTSGQILINKSLRMTGTGARSLIIQRSSAVGTAAFRVFEIADTGTTVDVANMTIRGGNTSSPGGGVMIGAGTTLKLTAVSIRENTGGFGGGIVNSGNLVLLDSTLSNNTATIEGGALRNSGPANIANSTLSGNTASNNGGGIVNTSTLTLNNVTISQNTGNIGGGIFNASEPINIRNTIIAANISGNGDSRRDVFAAFTSHGNNLIGSNNGATGFTNGVNGDMVGTSSAPIDPKLDSLGNDGGPTDTRSLLVGSPALHRGNNCVVDSSCGAANPPASLILDQRGGTGFPRHAGTYVDIGAFEDLNRPIITSINPQSWGAGGPAFEMTINGISFTDIARVRIDGVDRPATFVSSNQIKVHVSQSDLESPRTAVVVAFNPDGGSSAGVNFVVANCFISAQSPSLGISSAGGGASTLIMTTPHGCPWFAFASAPWINIVTPSGPGTGSFQITAEPNSGPTRNGSVTLAVNGGATTIVIPVIQSGGCTYSIPQTINLNYSATTADINIAAGAECTWMASTTTSWIQLISASGQGIGYVRFTLPANTGAARSGTITIAGQTVTVNQAAGPVRRSPFDFDGDGKTDIGIFRPAAVAEWWLNQSSTGNSFALQFGAPTDRIVPADYTGDGKADIAFFRPSSGEWYVLRSENFSFFALPFGTNGDVPVPADYDADGKADFAVFRPSNSNWFISQSSGAPTRILQFGISGDVPVVADYDGDAKADVGIFRQAAGGGEWWIQRSTAGSLAMQFGANTDKAVQGDYTGDGKADIAIWRPTTGEWFIVRSEDFSFYGFPFGASGDVVAPGDYDGDGKFDATVFRPTSATWFISRTTAGTQIVQFGATGDRPLPNAYVP